MTSPLSTVRRLSGTRAVELTLTPGWCLAGVWLPVRRLGSRGPCPKRKYFVGRGCRTQAAALRRLAWALEHDRGQWRQRVVLPPTARQAGAK